jgi:2-polyprenyl-6-methoxyphenol hydroxylase-like FAD-dependent oxidoreductase
MIDVPVLIVGGGPVGLTASILLSQHGVPSLLAERHSGTAILPKARGINARTMEMYRQCGVDQEIRDAGLPVERTGLIVWTKALAGEEIERRVPGRATAQNMAVTPVRNCLCAQDYLEPVLRRFAERVEPGQLRFDAEVTAVAQDAGGVTATLTDRVSGEETPVRAQYVIAADGTQSAIRRMLGVTMIGPEAVYDSVNILFNADLRAWTAHRPAALYFVEQPDLRATFLTINAVDRWGFLVHSLSAYDYTPEHFTAERSIALIRQAVGVPDLDVTILGVSFWEARRAWPTSTAMDAYSWPATPRTRCRRRADSASIPACRMCRTSRGSSRRSCTARRTRRCSTPTTRSGSRSAWPSPRRASPIRCRWAGPRASPTPCCRGPSSSTSRG